MNRRTFLAQSSLATAGLALAPDFAWANDPTLPAGINLSALGLKDLNLMEKLIQEGYTTAEFSLEQLKREPGLFTKGKNKTLKVSTVDLGPLASAGMRRNLPVLVESIKQNAAFEYQFLKAIMKDTTSVKEERPSLISRAANIADGLALQMPKVTTVFQNRYDGMLSRKDDLQVFVDALAQKNSGLALDVAHYTAGGDNLAEALSQFGDRIKILYLQDCILKPGVPTPEFCAVGEGRVDWDAVKTFIRKYRSAKLMVQLDAPGGDLSKAAAKAKAFLLTL